MTIYLSTQCLRDPSHLPAVLELYRMAELGAIALEGPMRLERESVQAMEGMSVWVHQVLDPMEGSEGLNLAAGDEDFRLRAVRRAEATLDLCSRVGAKTASFMPGYALEETFAPDRASRPISRSKALDQLKRSLDRISMRADGLGVALALTNSSAKQPSMLLAETHEIDPILHDLQIPFLGLLIDLDHLAQATNCDSDRADAFIAAQASHLVAFRLHERHRLPTPGGFVEDLLEHAALQRLPCILAARQLEFSSLLEERARLERMSSLPTYGPISPLS